MKQELNYLHVVNPAEEKPTTKTLTPQLIGIGIVIDDILYQPMAVDGDPLEQCEICDCQKPCFDAGADIAYCESFGDGYALHRMGRVFEMTITNETDER